MRNDFFGEMAETGGVPLNASPVRRWAGVFGHRPFAFSISMGIKNVLDDLLSSNYSGSIRENKKIRTEKRKAEPEESTHRKRINTQPKATKNKTINTGRKTSHTHNQSRKPKLYTRKRSHARLAPGFAADA